MRPWHIYVLIFVSIGILIGTLMARDPGYVLISYNGNLLQTSIWIFILSLGLAMAAIFYVMQSTSIFLRTTDRYKRWRDQEKKEKVLKHFLQGLKLLEEGEPVQAQRELSRNLSDDHDHVMYFISAARAANSAGDAESREKFLVQARLVNGADHQFIQRCSGQMAFERKDYLQSISLLKDLPRSRSVVELLRQCMIATENWRSLSELLRDIKKTGRDDELNRQTQKIAFTGLLSVSDGTIEEARVEYKKLDKDLRLDEDLVADYAKFLLSKPDKTEADTEAEKILRDALKSRWSEPLIVLYGSLGLPSAKVRLKQTAQWMKKHPDSIALLNCMGRAHLLMGNALEAKESFEKSMQISASKTAAEHLAYLHADAGDVVKSSQLLKSVLNRTLPSIESVARGNQDRGA